MNGADQTRHERVITLALQEWAPGIKILSITPHTNGVSRDWTGQMLLTWTSTGRQQHFQSHQVR